MSVSSIETQQQIESEGMNLGITRYRKSLQAKGEADMPPGIALTKSVVGDLGPAIQQWLEKMNAGKVGRNGAVVHFLSQFEPDELAYITARVALNAAMQGRGQRLTGASLALGSLLEQQLNVEELARSTPKLHAKWLRASVGQTDKYRVVLLKRHQQYCDCKRVVWGISERCRVGTTLLTLCSEATGVITLERSIEGQNNSPVRVVASQGLLDYLAKGHDKCSLLEPVKMPMVVRPLPWRGPFGGGYLTKGLQYPLVKSNKRGYLNALRGVDMPDVYTAMNSLQETRWRISAPVLAVLESAVEGGHRCGGLPPASRDPMPAREFAADCPADDPRLLAWKRKAAEVYALNATMVSKRVALSQKLELARKFSEFPVIYFPVQMDWRTRAYYAPGGINPQGDDLSKALLQFADGATLGETGAYWLAVHGANSYGVDKLGFDQRVQWVLDHSAQIVASADDPIGCGFWSETQENPWQFLAFCFEWRALTMWVDAGHPQGDFESRLCVSMDGTCNGIQHFAAMIRDEVGGAAVNLLPSETPADIYQRVADTASARVAQDAANGNEVAQRWVGKITRKLVKRNTMTVPYSVSLFGMRDQLMTEFRDQGLEGRMTDASYLADVNWDAISDVVVGARVAQQWLREVSKVASSDGLPVRWTTPVGFPVVQAYLEFEGRLLDFELVGRRFRLWVQVEGKKLDSRKQTTGIAPNFVHSLDAAAMMATVVACRGEGIRAFSMIHDSYGTHAGRIGDMGRILRQSFVDMYSGNVLQDLRDQLEEQLPPELAAKLPPVPERGNLDLSKVLESDYFFA